MNYLSRIEEKNYNREALTKEDIRFLREIDFPFVDLDIDDGKRIETIRMQRDLKKDMAKAFDCTVDEIGTTKDDAIRGGIRYFHGDLLIEKAESHHLSSLPERISGNLKLLGWSELEELSLPEYVGGDLDLRDLELLEGKWLPEYVGGSIYLSRLKKAVLVKFPETVHGNLKLDSLEEIDRIALPGHIRGSLNLRNLEKTPGLVLPEIIDRNLNLKSIRNLEKIKMPMLIGRNLILTSIEVDCGRQRLFRNNVPFLNPEFYSKIKQIQNTLVQGKIFFGNLVSFKAAKSYENFHLYRINQLFKEGTDFFADRKYEKSIEHLQKVPEEYDNCDHFKVIDLIISAYKIMGDAYRALNKLDECILNYKESISWGSTDPDLFLMLARVYFRKSMFIEALDRINWSIRLDPDNPESYKLKKEIQDREF